MLLADIVEASRRVGDTPSRLAKVAALAEVLRRLTPAEVPVAVAYLVGVLRQGRIGLGWAALQEAAAQAPGAGAPPLSLLEVDEAFGRIAAARGAGSVAGRRRLLGALFARASGSERDFLVRLGVGELRQGALEGLMLEALARAATAPAAQVRRAVMVAGALAPVAQALLAEGPAALARFPLQLMKPVLPMLAQPAASVAEALETLGGEAALEHKLDGARVQVHREAERVRVFSRSLRDVTEAVPEVVEAALALPARRLILDGEAIALTPGGAPLPFQTTMRRFGRKLEVEQLRPELPLSVFFFDVLHLEGEDLVGCAGRERFAALERVVPAPLRVPRLVTGEREAAEAFLAAALARGQEGLMAKSLAAPYEAGSRGSSWLKVKRAHTLDLVVLAAEWGHGRRSGWLSNLHLGARDTERGGWAMLGKTFKGLTDQMLAWQTERLQALALTSEGGCVHVRPELVVEVAFDGIQVSPRYPSGLALRLARVKRYRPDKGPAGVDTLETVRTLHLQALQRGQQDA